MPVTEPEQRGHRAWRALAAMRHARRSLAGKLMVVMLTTTAVALAVAGAALLFTDVRGNRAAWANDLGTEAAILSLASGVDIGGLSVTSWALVALASGVIAVIAAWVIRSLLLRFGAFERVDW